MNTSTEVAPGIFTLPLYKPGDCHLLVRRLKKLKRWEAAQVLVGPDKLSSGVVMEPDIRSARVLDSAYATDIYESFEARLDQVVKPLVKRAWHVEMSGHDAPQVVRYGLGGHYEEHVDGGGAVKERYFTVLCYLNDDFEGGRTSFPGLGYATTPRCGEAVLFPAMYLHSAEPVTRGEKFIILSWLTGPVTINWV